MREAARVPVLETPRLLLRGWRPADRPVFAALNADPRVMAHFPCRLTRAESDIFVDRIEERFARQGFGLWAVEVKSGPAFIGFVGLNPPGFTAHFTPCMEVGWRLAAAAWGRGYATEAARAAVDFGFNQAGLAEIVSFTVPDNRRSRAVMRRLGMTHRAEEDFAHPALPAGHRLRHHVLYRLTAAEHRSGSCLARAGRMEAEGMPASAIDREQDTR